MVFKEVTHCDCMRSLILFVFPPGCDFLNLFGLLEQNYCVIAQVLFTKIMFYVENHTQIELFLLREYYIGQLEASATIIYARDARTTQKHSQFCRQCECLFVCDTDMHKQSDERLEGCLQKPKACYLIPTSAVSLWAVPIL